MAQNESLGSTTDGERAVSTMPCRALLGTCGVRAEPAGHVSALAGASARYGRKYPHIEILEYLERFSRVQAAASCVSWPAAYAAAPLRVFACSLGLGLFPFVVYCVCGSSD